MSSSSSSESSSSSSSPEPAPPPRKRKSRDPFRHTRNKRRRTGELIISEKYNPPTWSTIPTRDSRWILRIWKKLTQIGLVPLFKRASFTTFGRHQSNDLSVFHESTSRLHAVIQHGNSGRVYVYDLSTHGTKVNGEKIEKRTHVQLKVGDKISFGESTRQYVLEPDERPETGPYGHLGPEDIDFRNGDQMQQSEATIKKAMKESHDAVLSSLLGGKMFKEEDKKDLTDDYLSRMKARSFRVNWTAKATSADTNQDMQEWQSSDRVNHKKR